MVDPKDDKTKPVFNIPKASTSELRGMQSVRATFRLTERAIGAISIVATQLGIKQKSLFDHLMEDVQALSTIARDLDADAQKKGQQRVQKTYVISRKTLSCLERISTEYDASRDALIEYSIKRLMPIIEREKEKHQHRKDLLVKVVDHFNQGVALLEEADDVLGTNDPVSDRIRSAIAFYENTIRDLAAYVEKGKVLEEF